MTEESSITNALSHGTWSTRLQAMREIRLKGMVAALPVVIAVLHEEGMRKRTIHQSVLNTAVACLKSGFITTAITVLVFLAAYVLLFLIGLVAVTVIGLLLGVATGFSEKTTALLFENPALDSVMADVLAYSLLVSVNAVLLFRWYLFGRHLMLRELHWQKGLVLFVIILLAAFTLGWCLGAVDEIRSGETPAVAVLLMWALLASLVGSFVANAVRVYDLEKGEVSGFSMGTTTLSQNQPWTQIVLNAVRDYVIKLRRLDDPALCRSLFTRHALLAVREITAVVAATASHAICPKCLVRLNSFDDPDVIVSYFRCRSCGRVYDGVSDLKGVRLLVAVLDRRWGEPSTIRNGLLFVNVLRQGALFDCDRVQIRAATDEEVERYVMAVNNDVDSCRHGRYGKIRCDVQAVCSLSEHTKSLLRATFGELSLP